jgi:hypothetical protein
MAHQTYGKEDEGDTRESCEWLLRKFKRDEFYIVFDMNPDTHQFFKDKVRDFLVEQRNGDFLNNKQKQKSVKFARVKCRWDTESENGGLKIVEVIPRTFPLRIGSSGFEAQGKACNQMNALMFASGHVIQALDCNMGTFIGECFKVPFLLKEFYPSIKIRGEDAEAVKEQIRKSMTEPMARFIGFREHIFTSRDGLVGTCCAIAEWTFGTIFQRFLSGMGARMHYGHPDFLDAFWARNRGGMSKCSPVINLSEDLFAGYNVRLREEKSPHYDFVEFEKGREVGFNAASLSFFKMAGAGVSMLRSRDNSQLCARVGVVQGLSFYFASVAFYFNNLLVDFAIYLYIIVFVLFGFSSLGTEDLVPLNSALAIEWILALGTIALVPLWIELMLEKGVYVGLKEFFSTLIASIVFFIFQNKTVASAVKIGLVRGKVADFPTGRPMANRHQSWRDMYLIYWKTHYVPAFNLLIIFCLYQLMWEDSESAQLPMIVILVSSLCWLTAPLMFSPYPRWNLVFQDAKDFSRFIVGTSGMDENAIVDVKKRKAKEFRNVYEVGLHDKISEWQDTGAIGGFFSLFARMLFLFLYIVIVPATLLEYIWVWIFLSPLQWLLCTLYLKYDFNNIYLFMSLVLWLLWKPVSSFLLVAEDAGLAEFIVSGIPFMTFLGLLRYFNLLVVRYRIYRSDSESEMKELDFMHSIRFAYIYSFDYQLRQVGALLLLGFKLFFSLGLILLEFPGTCGFVGLHTYFLLNSEVAAVDPKKKYMDSHSYVFEKAPGKEAHNGKDEDIRMRSVKHNKYCPEFGCL